MRPQIHVSLVFQFRDDSGANRNAFFWDLGMVGAGPSMMYRLELLSTAKALPSLVVADIALLAILVIPNCLEGRESHCQITWRRWIRFLFWGLHCRMRHKKLNTVIELLICL
jgi:hypothetical protein